MQIQIIVNRPNDKTLVLQVHGSVTVCELKQLIHFRTDVPPELQLLVFDKRHHDESETMEQIYQSGNFTNNIIDVSMTALLLGGTNFVRHHPKIIESPSPPSDQSTPSHILSISLLRPREMSNLGARGFEDKGAGCSYKWHEDAKECSSDPFDISNTKHVSVERLNRWRQAALVLNASRRFRYTLDLKKEQKRDEIRRKVRAHTQAIRACYLARETEERAPGSPKCASSAGDYAIGLEELALVTRDHDLSSLDSHGGVNGLSNLLKTDIEKGINGDDADLFSRRNTFGTNTYPTKKGPSFWIFLWDAWQDLTLIILMIAAAASFILGIELKGTKEGWYDGGSIAFAVMLDIIVTATNDYRQSLQFQNLNDEKRNIHLEVIRGGKISQILIYDLVVGDVLPLKIGDKVPADGIVIVCCSLAIDESRMTGETKIVHKDRRDPFLMSGCMVADGYGTMLVTGVGVNTEWGISMANIIEDIGEETPLQVRLNGVATSIGIIGHLVAFALLFVLFIRYFTGHTENVDGTVQFAKGKRNILDAVDGAIKIMTVVVTVFVVAVPEGLPLAVTLTLAYSMRKMMADKALVRRLSSCETMGFATTICSDKTGILTLNQMTVVESYVGGHKIDRHDNTSMMSSTFSSLLFEGITQNSTGTFFASEDDEVEVSGSATEKAIISWGTKLGMKYSEVKSKSSILQLFPFNSEKKQSGVALKLSNSEVHIHWKGAAEKLLALCTSYLDMDGCANTMDDNMVLHFKKAIEGMSASSLRCIALAYRLFEIGDVPKSEEQLAQWLLPEDNLILLAFVGIKDSCRPGIKEVVQLSKDAGVKVRMVTGDNLLTAKAIALECGILTSESDATEPNLIEGKDFRALPEIAREDVAEKILVMGRSSPNDKLLLVKALKKCGHVVAVTGDGTDDAPALHEADIGLAMGIQGTELAKESSDIILLDDNFASVVKVVHWGRTLYANVQKLIQFQLTGIVATLIIVVVTAIFSPKVPFTAVQIIWVNIIIDTLGALALATESPTDQLMHRPPVGRREPIITNIIWRNLLVQALYQATVLLVLNFTGKNIMCLKDENNVYTEKAKKTIIFNAFVFCQIFNVFNARKPDALNVFHCITKNYFFMCIVAITLVFQVIIIEFLGKFASTVKLDWKQWFVSIAIGFISWPLAIIGKLIPVPKTPIGEFFTRQFWFHRGSRSDIP